MAHYYQKRWVFTWNSDDLGDHIIHHSSLEKLLNKICKKGVFQKEKGEQGRVHYQGRFELIGPRTGKKQLLEIFSELGSVHQLTFSPERVSDSTDYCSKELTRVEGPWFCGLNSYRRMNNPLTLNLRTWQRQLLNQLSVNSNYLRDRKVIWVQDPTGGAGKSTFIKFLRFGKPLGLNFKKLPLDHCDRLRLSICKICNETDVDGFMFDFTRTFSEDTSFRSLFEVVEEIKNNYIVSVMYGKPLEVLLDPVFVLIFFDNNEPYIYN